MAQKVYLVASQKGGVGKSALAYALGGILSADGESTVVCDTDYPQFTIRLLSRLREHHEGGPLGFDVVACKSPAEAIRKAHGFKNVIIDGAPHASQDTYEYAKKASVVVMPTRTAIIDMTPNIELARDLESRGIPRSKIVFVLMQSPSKSETATARRILEHEGWAVLEQDLHFATSYSTAGDRGLTINEVKHRGLRYKADRLLAELTSL